MPASLQGNPYCRYQSHSGQQCIPMSNSFRGAQSAASPVSTLVCFTLWSPDMMATLRICVATQTNDNRGDGVPRGQDTRRKEDLTDGVMLKSVPENCGTMSMNAAELPSIDIFKRHTAVGNPLHFTAADPHHCTFLSLFSWCPCHEPLMPTLP